MSEGWGAPPAPGLLPPPPQPYRRPGPPWGLIVAGVAVVGLLGAAVLVGVLYVGSRDNTDDDRATRAELVTAPRDVVLALQDEGSAAAVTSLGVAGSVDLPAGDNAAARRHTDAAVTDFEAAVDEGSGPARVYRDALDAVGDLDGLRREMDGPARPGDLSYARDVQGRYGEIIAAVLDAHTRYVEAIDDPELRGDAELFEMGLQQLELVWLLGPEIADQARWTTSEGVSRLADLHGEMTSGREAVMRLAARGNNAGAARQLDAELEAAGTSQLLNQVLETGQGDVPALVQSVTGTTQAWHRFLAEVEATLTRPG